MRVAELTFAETSSVLAVRCIVGPITMLRLSVSRELNATSIALGERIDEGCKKLPQERKTASTTKQHLSSNPHNGSPVSTAKFSQLHDTRLSCLSSRPLCSFIISSKRLQQRLLCTPKYHGRRGLFGIHCCYAGQCPDSGIWFRARCRVLSAVFGGYIKTPTSAQGLFFTSSTSNQLGSTARHMCLFVLSQALLRV